MNFELSEEQQIIQDSVARFVLDNYNLEERIKKVESDSGYSEEHWQLMAGLGWLGLTVPGDYGGFDGNQIDTMVVMEELGKGLVVEPYFANVLLGVRALVADPAKLQWLNQHYIKALPRDALVAQLLPFLEATAQRKLKPTPELEQLVDLLRDRSKTLADMARLARFLVVDEIAYDDRAARKHLKRQIERPLADLHDRLSALEDWSEAALESAFDEVRARHDDLPVGKLAQPVRVAITGTDVSPGIFETLAVLGKRRTVSRLAEAIHFLRHG